jgi:hypothetical protein
MSSLVTGDEKVVFTALQSSFSQIAEQGPVVMIATFSNACPMPSKTEESLTNKSFGHVENGFDLSDI